MQLVKEHHTMFATVKIKNLTLMHKQEFKIKINRQRFLCLLVPLVLSLNER